MTVRVIVGERFEIVVPEEVRHALHLEPGDELLMDVRDGHAFVTSTSQDVVALMHGLHSEIWEGIDAQDYVRQERQAWRD